MLEDTSQLIAGRRGAVCPVLEPLHRLRLARALISRIWLCALIQSAEFSSFFYLAQSRPYGIKLSWRSTILQSKRNKTSESPLSTMTLISRDMDCEICYAVKPLSGGASSLLRLPRKSYGVGQW